MHQHYMQRCIDIAKNGLRAAMPNPSVGAVIVVDNRIIAEGFTSAFGGSHAEVNAINTVDDKSILNRATLYVSLEPCSHFGKTPPCCDLIIKQKIPTVVVGCLDPNPLVAGTGIERIRESGANVITSVLEHECRQSNKRFFVFYEKKRPFIILKWAQSNDGFIAPVNRSESKPFWLTNQYSQQLSHKWRTEEMAILVGSKTAIDDNPNLTARNWFGQNPTRLLLDPNKRVPKNNAIFNAESNTILLSNDDIDFSTNVASQITDFLFNRNLQSVIIEGGTQTIQTFIDENLWDEIRIFHTTQQLFDGTKAPNFMGKFSETKTILSDQLAIYSNL